MDIHKNLVDRATMKQRCDSDPEARAAAIVLCRKSIIAFFTYWLWTHDPRKSPSDIPFVPYDYQLTYIPALNQDIEEGRSVLTEKTRDMGVTWMVLGIFLYRWLFKNENFLLGSRKQEFVDTIGDMDSHFERLRYMLDKLPGWMVEACGWSRLNSGFMKLYKSNGASIVGEATTPNFSRQGRYKAILLDEFAFVEQAETVWRSTGDSSPCKLVVSTPNGAHNFFARLRKSNQLKVQTLHWRQHPNKDQAWYDAEKLKRSERDIAQELDISYEQSAGKPFYGSFNRFLHVRKGLTYNTERPIIRGWDYGYTHPACSFHQIDAKGRWVILKEIMGNDNTIQRFGEYVKQQSKEWFPNATFNDVDYGDPAGDQKSDKSEKTSVEILSSMGINVISRPSTYRERQEIIERKLNTIIDGIPALIIDESCEIIINGFLGGYHYPEIKDGREFTIKMESPFHDEFYSHLMNSMEYVGIGLFTGAESKDDNQILTYRVVGDLRDVRYETEDEDKYSSAYASIKR